MLHWFTYGAGIPVAIIFVSRGLELIPVLDRLHVSLYLVCLFYLFLLPSVCAARITNHCLGKFIIKLIIKVDTFIYLMSKARF